MLCSASSNNAIIIVVVVLFFRAYARLSLALSFSLNSGPISRPHAHNAHVRVPPKLPPGGFDGDAITSRLTTRTTCHRIFFSVGTRNVCAFVRCFLFFGERKKMCVDGEVTPNEKFAHRAHNICAFYATLSRVCKCALCGWLVWRVWRFGGWMMIMWGCFGDGWAQHAAGPCCVFLCSFGVPNLVSVKLLVGLCAN